MSAKNIGDGALNGLLVEHVDEERCAAQVPGNEKLSYGQLPKLTGFLLRKAIVSGFADFGDWTGDRAVTPLRYSVLKVIGANNGIRQAQVATMVGLSRPAATLAVDFWQSRGCVARRRRHEDRRSYEIVLTETGKQTLDALQKRIARHEKALTVSLSASDLKSLRRLLWMMVRSDNV